jgi:hypothetical protein
MLISECLFHTSVFAKSVSVALATPSSGNPSALTPRKFWQKQFRAPGKRTKCAQRARESRRRRPKEKRHANRGGLRGLGEDVYCAGTPVAGALYVLQGDNFARISVGGVGEERARIEKSKVLASAVVKRLSLHS